MNKAQAISKISGEVAFARLEYCPARVVRLDMFCPKLSQQLSIPEISNAPVRACLKFRLALTIKMSYHLSW
jgi:hypothetical protein